jgi:hypothetical protein
MSTETGEDTDFVILMSGEPQGVAVCRFPGVEPRKAPRAQPPQGPAQRAKLPDRSDSGGDETAVIVAIVR